MLALAMAAQGALLPSKFYVVATSFSDNGALFYYRLVAVAPDGPDSLIRYIRVAPADPTCPRMIVQQTQAIARAGSIAALVGQNNPCAIQPSSLRSTIRGYRIKASVLETISFGIVADCGSSTRSLELPDIQSLQWDRLKKAHPGEAHLWDLASQIAGRYFGEKDPFTSSNEQEDLALQRAGESILPELRSGRYDPGLLASTKAAGWRRDFPTFGSLLADYRGLVDVHTLFVAQLLNASGYRFSSYVAPKYPPIASQARVEGEVKLALKVDPTSGEVRGAEAVSGHPLLKPSAVIAAKQWRFEPNSLTSTSLRVTLNFSLNCP
jgi:TonB family protein